MIMMLKRFWGWLIGHREQKAILAELKPLSSRWRDSGLRDRRW